MTKFLSRKFISQLLAMGLSTWMLYLDKLDGITWAVLIGSLAGVYGGANILEHGLKLQEGEQAHKRVTK